MKLLQKSFIATLMAFLPLSFAKAEYQFDSQSNFSDSFSGSWVAVEAPQKYKKLLASAFCNAEMDDERVSAIKSPFQITSVVFDENQSEFAVRRTTEELIMHYDSDYYRFLKYSINSPERIKGTALVEMRIYDDEKSSVRKQPFDIVISNNRLIFTGKNFRKEFQRCS